MSTPWILNVQEEWLYEAEIYLCLGSLLVNKSRDSNMSVRGIVFLDTLVVLSSHKHV